MVYESRHGRIGPGRNANGRLLEKIYVLGFQDSQDQSWRRRQLFHRLQPRPCSPAFTDLAPT